MGWDVCVADRGDGQNVGGVVWAQRCAGQRMLLGVHENVFGRSSFGPPFSSQSFDFVSSVLIH